MRWFRLDPLHPIFAHAVPQIQSCATGKNWLVVKFFVSQVLFSLSTFMLVVLQAEEQRVLHKQQLEQEERLAEVRSQCPQLWLLHDLFCLVCFCTALGRQDSTGMGYRYDVVIVFMNRSQKSRLHNLSTYHAHIHARHPGFIQSPPPPPPPPLEPF